MERRKLLRMAGAGSLAALATPAIVGLTGSPAAASATGLKDAGAGIYTDLSVASQLSAFTIHPGLVTCAVGTFGASGQTGPFAMLMYSTGLTSFDINRSTRTITAKGRMISITFLADVNQENVEHDFIAIATDNRGATADRFDVHFVTPFWDPASNPMATKSDVVDGWARFGGPVVHDLTGVQMGGVTVSDSKK